MKSPVQRLAIVGAPGLVNFITAVAYHFCPSLPAALAQPGALLLADLRSKQHSFLCVTIVNSTMIAMNSVPCMVHRLYLDTKDGVYAYYH